MLDKRVTRLVKHAAGAMMVDIDDLEATVKLAGQSGAFDPSEEFGIPEDRVDATDISTQLAIAAGIYIFDQGIVVITVSFDNESVILVDYRFQHIHVVGIDVMVGGQVVLIQFLADFNRAPVFAVQIYHCRAVCM